MKKLFLILCVLIVVIILALLVLLFIKSSSNNSSTINSNPAQEFPMSGNSNPTSTGSAGTTNASNQTMSVTNEMGGKITTTNFLDNGKTVHDTSNTDQYYITGNVGACFPGNDTNCQGDPDYIISYRASNQAFIISLAKEPLGQSRNEAQQFLMKTLGISQTQMCNLNYYVLTTSDVNSLYSNENLGFSFCPGAVALPQ